MEKNCRLFGVLEARGQGQMERTGVFVSSERTTEVSMDSLTVSVYLSLEALEL